MKKGTKANVGRGVVIRSTSPHSNKLGLKKKRYSLLTYCGRCGKKNMGERENKRENGKAKHGKKGRYEKMYSHLGWEVTYGIEDKEGAQTN